MDYTATELMTINAARLLRDREVVFVGVGLPNLACNLARRTHAPELIMIYESGVIGAQPARLPLSIGDPTLVSGSLAVCGMYDIFSYYLQRGNIDVGFLGGAQIDQYANINATVIGDYQHPKVRLPGSGGSMEIAAWAKKFYIITPHKVRRLPSRVDFQTAVGNLFHRRERIATGVPGKGPLAVVTDLGILTPNEDGELVLTKLHPGATVDQVVANTGWQVKISPNLTTTLPPEERELHILRAKLDPDRIYLK